MAEKIAPPKDPFDAVGEVFTRLAKDGEAKDSREFWEQAAEVNYREIAFHSEMESKDVRVLVKALQQD